jgi:hypothetical protein
VTRGVSFIVGSWQWLGVISHWSLVDAKKACFSNLAKVAHAPPLGVVGAQLRGAVGAAESWRLVAEVAGSRGWWPVSGAFAVAGALQLVINYFLTAEVAESAEEMPGELSPRRRRKEEEDGRRKELMRFSSSRSLEAACEKFSLGVVRDKISIGSLVPFCWKISYAH